MHFKLILITSEQDINEEAAWINALFENGLPLLHIRKPTHTAEETQKLLDNISDNFHSQIVIHHHYELLHKYNLKGAHLPEKTRRESNITGIKNIISTSFHTIEDAVYEKTQFEYAFLSPVFSSISKKGYEPSISLSEIGEVLKQANSPVPFPLIALGGITDKNILQVKNAGFSGAACIGHVWESSNPVEQFTNLLKIIGTNTASF